MKTLFIVFGSIIVLGIIPALINPDSASSPATISQSSSPAPIESYQWSKDIVFNYFGLPNPGEECHQHVTLLLQKQSDGNYVLCGGMIWGGKYQTQEGMSFCMGTPTNVLDGEWNKMNADYEKALNNAISYDSRVFPPVPHNEQLVANHYAAKRNAFKQKYHYTEPQPSQRLFSDRNGLGALIIPITPSMATNIIGKTFDELVSVSTTDCGFSSIILNPAIFGTMKFGGPHPGGGWWINELKPY